MAMASSQKYSQKDSNQPQFPHHQTITTTSHFSSHSNQIPQNDNFNKNSIQKQVSTFQGTRGGSIDNLRTTKAMHQQVQSSSHNKNTGQNQNQQVNQFYHQQYHAQKPQQSYESYNQNSQQDRQLNEKQLQQTQTSIAPSLNFKKLGPSDQQQQNFTVRFSNYRDQEPLNPSVNNNGQQQTKQTGRSVGHSLSQHDVVNQTNQSSIKTTAPSSHPEAQIKYGGFNSTYSSASNLKFNERRASAAPIISQQSYGSQVLNNTSQNTVINQQKHQFSTIQQQSDSEQSNNYYKTSNNLRTIQSQYGGGEIQNKMNSQQQTQQDNYNKAQQYKNSQINQKSPQNTNFSEKFVLNQILQRAQTSKQSSVSPKNNNQGMISQFQKVIKNNGEQASSVSSSSTNTINASMLPIHKLPQTQLQQNEHQDVGAVYKNVPDNISSKQSQNSINKKSLTFIAQKQSEDKYQNDSKHPQIQQRLHPSNSENTDFYERQSNKTTNNQNFLSINQHHTQSQQIISSKSSIIPNSTKNVQPQTVQSSQLKSVSSQNNQVPTPKSSSRPPMNIKQPAVVENQQLRQTNSRQYQQQNIVGDTYHQQSQQQPSVQIRMSASQDKIDLKQVSQMHEGKNQSNNLDQQNKHFQVRDLRKIRDESTQGSQSRAPNLSEIQNLQQQKNQRNENALQKRGVSNDNSLIQQKGAANSGQLIGRNTQQSNSQLIKKQQNQQQVYDNRRNSEQNGVQQSLQKNESQQQNIFYNTLNQGPVKVSRGSSGSVNQINGLNRQNSQQYFSLNSQNQSTSQAAAQNQIQHQNEEKIKEQVIQHSTHQANAQKVIINQNNEVRYKSSIDVDQKDLLELINIHPLFIGQTNFSVQQLFKQNEKLLTQQIKQDPASGSLQKIQQFTTLDINKMIHENSAEEENENEKLALQPGARIIIPNKEPTKCSIKRNGIVRAYSAITNQGLVRTYNEDRVSIILNITKPNHRKDENWPKCSFFGVYDGHGGHTCAEFLRDQLHHFVIKQDCFPQNPREAIIRGFKNAEETFLQKCQVRDETGNGEQNIVIDRSGSCAIVILIVGDMCFSANVGDSRAIMSIDGGKLVVPLSRDHKPSDINEYNRITKSGGQVYQTITSQIVEQDKSKSSSKPRQLDQKHQQLQPKTVNQEPEYIIGPIRVLPGRLSVSRTFGDPEAKLAYRGGNINVVKAEPEIREFKIQKSFDFILLASDGVFDKMSNDDMSKCVWDSCDKNKWQSNPNYRPAQSVHQQCGLAVESVLKNSLYRQSLDNVTVVMIAFQNFKRQVFGQGKNSDREENQNLAGLQNKVDQEEKKIQGEEINQNINQKSRNEDQALLQKRDVLTKNNLNYKSQILKTQLQRDQVNQVSNQNNNNSIQQLQQNNQQNRFYQTQEVNQTSMKEDQAIIKNKEQKNSYRIIQTNKQSQLQTIENQDQQHSSHKPPSSHNQQNLKPQYQQSQKSISTLSQTNQIKVSKVKNEISNLQINQDKKIRGTSGSKITTPSSSLVPSSSQKTLVTNVSSSNQTTSTRAGSRQASQTYIKAGFNQMTNTNTKSKEQSQQNFQLVQMINSEAISNGQLTVPQSVKSSQIIQKNNEEQKRQNSQRSTTGSINHQQLKQQSFQSNNQLTSSQSSYIISKNSQMISQISAQNLNSSNNQKPSSSSKRNSSKGQLQNYISNMDKNLNAQITQSQQQAQMDRNVGQENVQSFNKIKNQADLIQQNIEKIQQHSQIPQSIQQHRNSQQFIQKDTLTSQTPKQIEQLGSKNTGQVPAFIQNENHQQSAIEQERGSVDNHSKISPKLSQNNMQDTSNQQVDHNQTQINLFFKEGLIINIQ